MPTKAKLKINDSVDLRNHLNAVYETATQQQIARWALNMVVHILQLASPKYLENEAVINGIAVNQLWQEGKARMHDVRQAGFRIHQLAKDCEDERLKIALRVVGQAVATGHMKEYGMVASDYAIKYVNLVFPNSQEAVVYERSWQIHNLENECLK